MRMNNEFNENVESDATKNKERVIRSVCMEAGDGTEDGFFVHFSFLDGAFFAAMKRARLEGSEHTFASDNYYTGDASAFNSADGDGNVWIWMPVETKADRRYLFSVKPWEESGMIPEFQKKTAKKLKEEFKQFRKEMLP